MVVVKIMRVVIEVILMMMLMMMVVGVVETMFVVLVLELEVGCCDGNDEESVLRSVAADYDENDNDNDDTSESFRNV